MIYAFDGFEADDELFELRRGGTRVSIQRRSLDLLMYLLEQRARVVLRRELIDRVWDGINVTDNAIAQATMTARRAIEREGEPPAIETVRGRGYRFVRNVRVLGRSELPPTCRMLPAPVVLIPEPASSTDIADALGEDARGPRFVVDAAETSSVPLGAWTAVVVSWLATRGRSFQAPVAGRALDFVLGAVRTVGPAERPTFVLRRIDEADASSQLLLASIARGLVAMDAVVVATHAYGNATLLRCLVEGRGE